MKAASLLLLLSLFTVAVSHAGDVAVTMPIVTEQTNVAKYVGQKITIVGKVSNTKMPQILGVDVSSGSTDIRGRMAEATGVLERFEVTEAQIKEMDRLGIAHRGPGVFYRLRDEKKNAEAQVRERK